MPIVTFLSDFGWQDHYVAAVKAKIITKDPQLQIVDISHEVQKFNIIQSAHILKAIYQDFPEGTVHIVAVNTSNIHKAEPIALKMNGHYFIGTNNGLFSLVEEKTPEEIIQLEMKEPTSFPAKEIFAEAAVQIIKEGSIEKLGSELPLDKYQKYMPQRVKANRELIQGHVMHIDGYGNLITNIEKRDFDILSKDKSIVIKFRNYGLTKVLRSYSETQSGEAFAIFNTDQKLEIGIKEGNASELLGLEYGSMVSIKFNDY